MKKSISFLLALVLLLSLAAPILPARAEAEPAQQTNTPDLKVGILSDIHISTDYFGGVQPQRWKHALQLYKTMDLDAIVVTGDLQESAGTSDADVAKQEAWMDIVVNTWYEVFPEKPGEDGFVEPIFIYGNHDATLISRKYWPAQWGSYQDSYTKEVNGYQFVCAHNAKEHTAGGLVANAVEKTPDKPVFYIQHCPIFNTVPSSGDTGYGTGYARNGRNNISNYHNVIAFSGHTHTPLSDARSIWQGADWNDGQFTSITCGTINYSYINEDGLSINGNGNLTQHGMVMEVTGSDVRIVRYNLTDATVADGAAQGLITIGQPWEFDACDPTDRPYTYEKQKAAATAPAFPSMSRITVGTVADTSVAVTIPAAQDPSLVRYYLVEATDPLTREVEAIAKLSAEYHVDAGTHNYGSSYNLTVSGLRPGKEYILKAYAVDFFENRSVYLGKSVITTGDPLPGQAGDVNGDGKRSDADVAVLKQILRHEIEPTPWADVDGNNLITQSDMTALMNILEGRRVIQEAPEQDLFGHSDRQTIGNGAITEQSAVVRGDSAVAIEVKAETPSGWPYARVFFDTPQDLSHANTLYLDTLFPNEPIAKYRYFTLSLISGQVENWSDQIHFYLDPDYEGWTTLAVDLGRFDNVDWEHVTGLRFNFNLDDTGDSRWENGQMHTVYIDNVRVGLTVPEAADTDLFAGAALTGGDWTYARGQVRDSHEGIGSDSGSLQVMLAQALTVSEGGKLCFDAKASGAVTMQALDSSGAPIGTASTLKAVAGEWVWLTLTDLGLDSGAQLYGFQFTFTGTLYLDNLSYTVRIPQDDDLIGIADAVLPVGEVALTQTMGGSNHSLSALLAQANPDDSVWAGGAELCYDTPLDLSGTPNLRLDLKMENAHWAYTVSLYDPAGNVIWESLYFNATASGGKYATYELDLRAYQTYESGSYVTHKVSAEALTEVAKIRITADLASAPKWTDDDPNATRSFYIDNLIALDPLSDTLAAATGVQLPNTGTGDGFVLEMLDSFDGRDNVLHMYANPDDATAVTAAYLNTSYRIRGIRMQSYTGDMAQTPDYFQFTIRETGVYPELALYFKDASGNILGQTTNYRTARTSGWTTYRIDLDTLGLTAQELPLVDEIVVRFWWGYQMNSDTSADRAVGDIYIADAGFCSIAQNGDLLDRVTEIRNSDFWYGYWNHYPGAGWLYQSDVTVDSDSAFQYYRSAGTSGNYNARTLYMTFDEALSVESDWIISMDILNENYAHNCLVDLIGSDGKYYSCFTVNSSGASRPMKLVSQLEGFDPEAVTITGLRLTNRINADANVDDTRAGWLVYDNLHITAPAPEEDIVVDMLDSATFEFSNTKWNNGSGLTYTNACTDVTNPNSLTSWQFGAAAENGGWPYVQLHLNGSYDLTGKDIVFDVKFDHDNHQPRRTISLRLYDKTWSSVTVETNYGTLGGVVPGDGWQQVVIDSSAIQAKLKADKDLTQITLISIHFAFENDKGYDRTITIDNLHLVDDVDGTADTDAATDLLANAAYTVENADTTNFGYTHNAPQVSHGDDSLYAHKFYATPEAEGDLSVLYTLDKSYDLTDKNLAMDVMFFHAANYFYVQLFDSNMEQVTSGSGSIQGNTFADINIDLLSALQSGKNLTDVKYLRITTRFANNALTNKAVYVDNVRIFDIDTYDTALNGADVLFIGDSITVASPFKGWDGELKEHYGIRNYNVGVGGSSYMSKSGRSLIPNQVTKIDHSIDYDYIIINGGVNDIWDLGTENDTVLGQVSDLPITTSYEQFDASTTASGMERLFAYLKQNFPNAKIGFIITYACDLAGYSRDNYIELFVPLAQSVCDKWGIPYFDIVNHPVLGTEFHAHEYIHTVDGVHANNHGYELIVEHLAPWMLELKAPTAVATEATERASDILGGAGYNWSAAAWGTDRFYDSACTDVYGDKSLRSWKFTTSARAGGNPDIELYLSRDDIFDLTGKSISMDVKFECDGATPSQKLGIRLTNASWAAVTSSTLWVTGNGSDGWQTITIDADQFQSVLAEGMTLDQIYVIRFFFDFATNSGKEQSVTIDNLRVLVNPLATQETEENTDMLANATYVSGRFDGESFFLQEKCDIVNSPDSLYSKRFSAVDGLESWPNAKFDLGRSYDLTGKGLQLDIRFVNAYKTLGIRLYNSAGELVSNASTDLVYSQWHTVDVDILKKVTEGKDLTDVRYIEFGFTFLTRYTDQSVIIDNLRTYPMPKAQSALDGMTALYLGDSISEAIGFKGWAGELEEHYGVKRYNVSSSGAVLASGQGHRILTQLNKAPADTAFDFILSNGGVNDVWMGSVEMGEVTAAGVTECDTTTAAGALEELFSTLKARYPDSHIGFILNYNCAGSGFDSEKFRDVFAPLARAACEKWDVYCLDLVDNDAFTAEFSATAGSHTYDGVHANQAGYEVLTSYISRWMGQMIGAQIPSMEDLLPVAADEASEQDSDLLAYAELAWNPAEWGTVRFYDPACQEVCGLQSTRSWKFSTGSNGSGWPAMQISLPKVEAFDLEGKAIEFDVKFQNARQGVGMQIFDKSWNCYTGDNAFIWQHGDGSNGWQTLRYSAEDFIAKLSEGKTLGRVYLLRFIFDFETNKGSDQAVIIDNVRIVDLTPATEQQEADSDLLSGAAYVSGNFDKLSFARNDSCTVTNGSESLSSRKLYALDGATGTPSAMYDLGKSVDMTGKTLHMDFCFLNTKKYIGIKLYDSEKALVSQIAFHMYIEHWQTIQVDITRNLLEGQDLTDVRYLELTADFSTAGVGRAVYIDNVRLTDTVTVDSVLTGKNVLFMGDSICESGCYKAWAGEMEEHYGVKRYNVSRAGARIAAGQGHCLMDQLANAPAGVQMDYILLNGGVNDVWLGGNALGTVTAEGVTTFDTTTTAGALEQLFSTLKSTYPNAKIGFILNYNCSGGGFNADKFRDEFAPVARAVCQKWEIPCLDLLANSDFNEEFDTSVHTYDGVHANQEGYDILTNYIAPFLGSLTGDSVPAYRDMEQ